MKKVIILLVIILCAVGSIAGYLFLNGKIKAGEEQLAVGQKKFDTGQASLDKGKVKLEAGKQQLSEGKKEYEEAKDSWFLVFADKVLKGGKGFKDAEMKIAAGDRQVSKGEDKVNAGERRLDAGERELIQGREQLHLARKVRVVCALGAAVFSSLAIVLGFWWRRSLK